MAKMFISLVEAAKILATGPEQVHMLVNAGHLQEFRDGDERVVKREQVEALKDEDVQMLLTGRFMSDTTPAPDLRPKMHHGAVAHVLQFFAFAHLPAHLQKVSQPFHELAYTIADASDNPETTIALRKLLEAKDAAVRAVLIKP